MGLENSWLQNSECQFISSEFCSTGMMIVDDREVLLNKLYLILERVLFSFCNVIGVKIFQSHNFFPKKLTCCFKSIPWPFCVPYGFLKVSGDMFSENTDLISSQSPAWKKITC